VSGAVGGVGGIEGFGRRASSSLAGEGTTGWQQGEPQAHRVNGQHQQGEQPAFCLSLHTITRSPSPRLALPGPLACSAKKARMRERQEEKKKQKKEEFKGW